MKQNFKHLVMLCALLPMWCSAQSLQVVEANTNVSGIVGKDLRASVKIKNVSDREISLQIIQQPIELKNDQAAYFKLDNKITRGKRAVSANIKKLQPGEILQSFTAFLSSDFQTGRSQINYLFYDADLPEDSLSITLSFLINPHASGDNLYANDYIVISNLYPNPATEFVAFDYKLSSTAPEAKITIRNVLGSEVKSHELSIWDTKTRFPIGDLKPGVYFYTLSMDEQNLVTRKFMVKR